MNNYSYYVEILTIVYLEERKWYGESAILENDNYSGFNSYYESIKPLLKDINYIDNIEEKLYDSQD